jgi:hypothetical protein
VTTTPRLLLRFALGGVLLVGLGRACGHDPGRAALRVEVPAGSDAAVEVAIDEALLLDAAERAQWPRRDAIVRARIAALLGAIDDDGDPEAAIDRAIAQGLHRRDPIARRRLVLAATRALGDGADPAAWSDALLAEYGGHPERYTSATRTEFTQVFVSCDGDRDDDCEREAASIAAALEGAPADVAITGADPWPWTRPGVAYASARLDALFGAGFGAAIASAPVGRWSGPHRSAFGLHLVYVQARHGGEVRTIAEVLPRLQATLEQGRRDDAVRAALDALRRERTIEVVSVP